LGRNRRGRNKGVREVREVWEVALEVAEEVREEESEDNGIRMVHVIDEKLDEVWRKVDRTDVMVRALVRKGIGKGLQEVLEKFVEGLGDKEPEDLNSFEGIDNRYVVKMRRLEKLGEEVRREWYEAMVELESMEEDEAEETEEEEEEKVRSEEEEVGSSEESKYSTEVDYEELDKADEVESEYNVKRKLYKTIEKIL